MLKISEIYGPNISENTCRKISEVEKLMIIHYIGNMSENLRSFRKGRNISEVKSRNTSEISGLRGPISSGLICKLLLAFAQLSIG